MKDTIVVEASASTNDECDMLTTTRVGNDNSSTRGVEKNQEERNVHSGLGPAGTGKTFVV